MKTAMEILFSDMPPFFLEYIQISNEFFNQTKKKRSIKLPCKPPNLLTVNIPRPHGESYKTTKSGVCITFDKDCIDINFGRQHQNVVTLVQN